MRQPTLTHITIVHQAALGDSVLLIPLFRSLRQRFSPCAITLVTRTALGHMLTQLGLVDAHASADDRDHTLWFAPPEGGRPNSTPPWAECDLLLSAVAAPGAPWAANARLARPGRDPNSVLFFSPRPPPEYPGHVTAWQRRQLPALGLAEAPGPPLRKNLDGAVVLHPGSGGDEKCWPRRRFLALGRALKRRGIVPTFILGEVEQERWGQATIEGLTEEFPCCPHMGLSDLAKTLSQARLYLGNDSGVTHLAAALGVPVIALFGPSNEMQWSPVGPAVRILRPPAPHERNLEALEEEAVLHEMLAELRRN